jgi:hypothetical protein
VVGGVRRVFKSAAYLAGARIYIWLPSERSTVGLRTTRYSPGKVRSGISGTRITALTPGAKANAWSYGTKTWVRVTLLRMHQNMKVLASTRAADVNRPMGDDPSNGAITR